MAIRGGLRQYTDREKSECDRGKHREFEIEKLVGTLPCVNPYYVKHTHQWGWDQM